MILALSGWSSASAHRRSRPYLKRLRVGSYSPMPGAAHDGDAGFLARNAESRTIGLSRAAMTIADATALDRAESDLDRTGSPLARRATDKFFECSAECSLGFVADFMSDGGNLDTGICQALGGNLHPPLGQILNRRTAH